MFLTVVIGCKYFVKMNSDIGANITPIRDFFSFHLEFS